MATFKKLPAYRIRRIAESIFGLAEELFSRHLSFRTFDWRVLVKLSETPGSIATEIGREMLMTPVQTGRSLEKLRELELIIGETDPQDGRAVRYTLTKKGHSAHQSGQRIVLAVQARALREMSAVERVALDGLLDRLMADAAFTEDDADDLSEELFGKGTRADRHLSSRKIQR